jgi:hypothetical protein
MIDAIALSGREPSHRGQELPPRLFMYSRNDAFVGRGLDLYGEWCDFEIRAIRPSNWATP